MRLVTPILAAAVFALAVFCENSAFAESADPAAEPAVIAVSKTMPAVVNIAAEGIIKREVRDPSLQFFDYFNGNGQGGIRELRQKVQSLGSGFIVDPQGYIVTNQHVVAQAADLKIQVTTSDGKSYNAHYITGDPAMDLAFIKIDGDHPFPCIDLQNLSPNLLGETVLALGNPLGYGSAVSRGILSAMNRSVTVENVEYNNLVQTDAAINPGNSGGPLVDLSGRLVGINSVKMSYTPQGVPTQGMGFAIPGSVVRSRVAEFMREAKNAPPAVVKATDGSRARKLFGIEVQPLTPELSDALGFEPGRGVLVADVEDGSPASDAGLQRGLVIFKVGRFPVNSPDELEKILAKAAAGDQADFMVGLVRQLAGRNFPQLQTVTLTAR
jgi:serine protease Do